MKHGPKSLTVRIGAAVFLIGAIAIQLYALRELENSTSWITWVEDSEIAETVGQPDPRIAGLRWPAEWYVSSTEMQPFREFFRSHCEGKKGIAAASCVSN